MEGYGKVQYSQELPAFPICAMQLHRTIGIPVFPNMVTWNAGSDAFFAPAVLGMVDAAEACLILEHKAHFSPCGDFSINAFCVHE